jgi:hypothetical protein
MAASNKLSLFNTLGVLALAVGLPCIGTISCIGMPLWSAWLGESREVSGVTAVQRDGAAYLVVSGYSEHS